MNEIIEKTTIVKYKNKGFSKININEIEFLLFIFFTYKKILYDKKN